MASGLKRSIDSEIELYVGAREILQAEAKTAITLAPAS
jgi:hypothetical protein